MARDGRDELELYLDEQQSVRAARDIQKSIQEAASSIGQLARSFDANWNTAFAHVEQNATKTARKIRSEAEAADSKLKILNQGLKDVALGSFAGGFSATAVATAIQSLVGFAQEAGKAYLEGNRSATLLENTTKRYNLSLAETQAQVAKLRQEYNLSATEAENLLSQTRRAAGFAGTPEKGFELATGLLNVAEGSGIDKSRIGEFARMIATGEDQVFDALWGKNPSAFYEEWAKANDRTAASLTDLEKIVIRLNKGIEGNTSHIQEHIVYADSAAAKWERWTAAIADFKREAGEGAISFTSARIDDFWAGVGRVFGNEGDARYYSASKIAADKARVDQLAAEAAKRPDPAADAATRLRAAQEQALRDLQVMLEYQAAALDVRNESPLAQIRRNTRAEIERITKANTVDGKLTTSGAQLVGLASSFGAQDEAKRILEVNRQLDAQLADIQAKYSGDQNPLVQLAQNGKREMDLLLESVQKLGPEFTAQGEAVIAAAQKLQDLNFAKGLVQNYLNVSNLDARMASLEPAYATGRKHGRYGQITDDLGVLAFYKKETEIGRAQRQLRALDAAIAENPNEPELQRAARQALLAQTANLSPEALGADPTTRDRIRAELQRERDQRIADREEAAKERQAQREAREKQNAAADATIAFHQGLADAGMTPADLGVAIKALKALKVAVDLNVKSDRAFDAAVNDGTALDRVTTG